MKNVSVDPERFRVYLKVALLYFLFHVFDIAVREPETFLVRTINTLWRMPYIIAINYIFFEWIVPRFGLTWRKLLVAPLLIMLQLFLCSAGLYLWRMIGIALHIHTSLVTYQSVEKGMQEQSANGVMSLLFFGIVLHIFNYRKLREQAHLLRIQKQEAELNYLKSQTNPHFLFNTLNNIYALARDKSERAPESILRLSKILRYMLYETGGNFIAIEQELKIISDYIELEKLRYDKTLRINFNYDVEDMKQSLPPLLLIPLVENAFKHGVSETRNLPFIDIHLSLKDRRLEYVVKNSTETVPDNTGVKENIGLSNLRRQLELLYTDYNLAVVHGEGVFTATLKINLTSYVKH